MLPDSRRRRGIVKMVDAAVIEQIPESLAQNKLSDFSEL